MEEENEQV